MAAAIDRNVWLVQTVTLLFWSFCVSPTGANWCSETVANRSPSNSSECEVEIKPPSSIFTYYGAYQSVCMAVTSVCLIVNVNENDLVNFKAAVSKNSTNGYLWADVALSNITANDRIIFTVFDPPSPATDYETDILVYELNFDYEIGCTSVEFYWTPLPEFTYSVVAICGDVTKPYSDLTSNSQSMELIGDQESCDVFLNGTREGGWTQNYSQTVPLFQDPSQCVKNMPELHGLWYQGSVDLSYLLTLSCDCPSTTPTVIYIESSKNSSYVKCNVQILECDGSLASTIFWTSDTEIEVVLHGSTLLFPSELTVTARACNPAGCISNLTQTIETPSSSTSPPGSSGSTETPSTSTTQPGTTADEDSSPTSISPNYFGQILGAVLGCVALALAFIISLLCVCYICHKHKKKKKKEYSNVVPEKPTNLAEEESFTGTGTGTTSDAELAVVKLDNGSVQYSVVEKRKETKVPPVGSQNPPFIGGGVSDTQSNRGNPITAPSREDDKNLMVSSNYVAPLKSSSSAAHLHSLTEEELQAKHGVHPLENPNQVSNPPQNESITTDTCTSNSEESQDLKDVGPPVPT